MLSKEQLRLMKQLERQQVLNEKKIVKTDTANRKTVIDNYFRVSQDVETVDTCP